MAFMLTTDWSSMRFYDHYTYRGKAISRHDHPHGGRKAGGKQKVMVRGRSGQRYEPGGTARKTVGGNTGRVASGMKDSRNMSASLEGLKKKLSDTRVQYSDALIAGDRVRIDSLQKKLGRIANEMNTLRGFQ